MNRQFRYFFRKFAHFFIAIILFFYFLYHILSGNYGWFAWNALEKQLKEDQKILTVLEEEEKKLKNRVRLMRSKNLDPDLLDEQSRDMLHVVDEKDQVIVDDGEDAHA